MSLRTATPLPYTTRFRSRMCDERAPGRTQIDDVRGEPELRCDLHRAVQFDALGLDALRLEPAARRRRIFGRDADMALAEPRRRAAFWPRDRKSTRLNSSH